MDIKNKIREILKDLYGVTEHKHYSYCSYPLGECCCRDINKISDTSSIINEGYIDSMSLITLITEIEKVFVITINHTDIFPNNFDSIDKMEKVIKKYL